MFEKQIFNGLSEKNVKAETGEITIPFRKNRMKFVLFFTLAFWLTACASSDNPLPNNQGQNSANVNKSMPNATVQPNVSVNNAAKNTANPNTKIINLGEKITLKGGETRKVKDTELNIKIIIIGSQSLPSATQNASSGAGIGFCRVDATLGIKTDGRQLYNQPGRNEFEFEGFKIRVENVTPGGNADCTLVVTKIGK